MKSCLSLKCPERKGGKCTAGMSNKPLRERIIMDLLMLLNLYGVLEEKVKKEPQALKAIAWMLEDELKK